MILIDKPFVSDFLIKTIKENKFPIVSTMVAREMISDDSLNWITEQEAREIFYKNPNTPLYSNSENAIGWIEQNLGFTNLPNQINIFKNKIRFRELLKDAYPNFLFQGIKFEKLKHFNAENLNFPFIIKPAVGFFSLGVYKVDSPEEWKSTVKKIETDINVVKGAYPKEVVNIDEFIIEECVAGEEFAIDCYFDNEGNPVILNIFHHLFSSKDDLSDRVYSTSEKIIESIKNKVKDFLNVIGKKVALQNFPAHIEIRIDEGGRIIPIEVNPLRFGGWCTTGDLSWFSYEINSYEYFFKSLKPDWSNIFETRKNKIYSNVVLDNTTGYDFSQIQSFNYDLLLNDFQKPLDLRKINMAEYPVFGFLFTETEVGNEKELNQILSTNLRKYITLKQPE